MKHVYVELVTDLDPSISGGMNFAILASDCDRDLESWVDPRRTPPPPPLPPPSVLTPVVEGLEAPRGG